MKANPPTEWTDLRPAAHVKREMSQNSRPPTAIAAISVALLAYAALNAWYGFRYGSALFALWIVPSLLCAAGLILRWPWSRYVLLALNICTFLGWAAFTLSAWSHYELTQLLKLAGLGVAIAIFGGWSAVVVRRYLSPASSGSVGGTS